MAFTDHKINAFTHKITDLADQPNMPPDELKARFDACPEQLRVSLNAVCDEATRLDERVSGIVAGAFGDTIDKSMLSAELAAQIDSAAAESSVAERLEAETTARESADSALSTRVSSLESSVPQKSEIFFGTYIGTGTGTTKKVSLGFTPRAVLVVAYRSYYDDQYDRTTVQLAVQGADAKIVKIVSGGFTVTAALNSDSSSENPYRYLAVK